MRRRSNAPTGTETPESGSTTVFQPIPTDSAPNQDAKVSKSRARGERQNQGKYGCPYCHSNFPHPCLCRNHCGKTHPELPVPSQPEMVRARYDDFRPPLPVKAFACPLCSISRKSYNGLLEHLRSAHSMKRDDYPTRQTCLLLSQKRNAEREVYVQYHRQMMQIRNQNKCTVCGKKLMEGRTDPMAQNVASIAKNCVCGSAVCSNCVAYDSGFCLSRGYINGSACGAHSGQIFGDRAPGIAWNILHPMSCDNSYSQGARLMTVPGGNERIESGTVLFYGSLNALIGARSHMSEMGSRQYVQALMLPQLGATKTMLLPVTRQRDVPMDALDQRFFSDTLQDRAFSQYAAGQLGPGQMDVVLVSAFDSSFLPALKHSESPNVEIQMICVRTPRAALINNQVLPELLHAEVVFAVVTQRAIAVGEELTVEIKTDNPVPGIRHTVNTLYDHAEREQTVLSNVLRQRDMQNTQSRSVPMQMM